jgi:hypothetical protein
MSTKTSLLRIHRGLWVMVTMITGILAGFLTSHSVLLGRYFTWLIDSGNYRVFKDTFALFREASHANVHYNLFLWASLIIGTAWAVVCILARKERIVALIAGLSSFWVGSVFFASGFAAAEEAVCTGAADAAVQQFYATWNLPLHTSFAIFYTVCFCWLLLSGAGWITDRKAAA